LRAASCGSRKNRGVSAVVTQHDIGRRTVLSVAGEIDIATAPILAAAADRALAAGAAELWIDLGATRFLDASGIHVLAEAKTEARELNRQLVVICPRGRVRRVLEICGMLADLNVFEDRATAQRAA
jgi:anti-sigma B factor antagonist